MLTQGLILMVTGMTVVFLFLGLIVAVINVVAYLVKFLPEEAVEVKAGPKILTDKLDDIAVALASVYSRRKRS